MKEAYEVLGVRKDASKDEIIKRYHILLRKYKSQINEGAEDDKEVLQKELDDILAAYNELMGYSSKEDTLANDNVTGFKKKLDHFFYYYKYHLIFGTLFALIVGFFIYDTVTKVHPDLTITFIGAYGDYYKTEELEKSILSQYPDMKKVQISVLSLTEEQNSGYAAKAALDLSSGDRDIYIMDKEYFTKFVVHQGYEKIDGILGELGIDTQAEKAKLLTIKVGNEKPTYGIDISEKEIFTKAKIIGKEKILVLSNRARHRANAVRFFNMMLENSK